MKSLKQQFQKKIKVYVNKQLFFVGFLILFGGVFIINIPEVNAETATYYSTWGAPRCTSTNSPCDAPTSLLQCAGTQTAPGPEANQPNTLDTCADMANGICRDSNESVESITVTEQGGGGVFNAGESVTVNFTIYCFDTTSDRYAVYYSNSATTPSWVRKTSGNPICSTAGFNNLSETFNIDNNSGYHAVRVINEYNQDIATACDGVAYTDYDDLAFNVAAANTAPTDIKLDGVDTDSVDENTASGITISILTSIDADTGDTHTYSLVAGTGDEDNTKFTLSGTNNENLEIAFVPDFENPTDLGDTADNNTYSIRIQTDDGNGGTYEEFFIITINDLNLAPTNIDIGGANTDTQIEGTVTNTVIGVLTNTDDGEDNSEIYTYSLACAAPGVDDSHFNINGSDLRNTTVFDFENPVDTGGDNTYDICVRVTETNGGLLYDENLTITVTNLNTAPTDIYPDIHEVMEGQIVGTTIGLVTASDDDLPSETFTFSLTCASHGVDDSHFSITADTLKTATVFDHDIPVDASTDNDYEICIRVTDGNSNTYDENITVTVIKNLKSKHKKIIFSNESPEFIDNAFTLDINSYYDKVDLRFGADLNVHIQFDRALDAFLINRNLDLGGNQILNFKVENQSTQPICNLLLSGRVFFNTTDSRLYGCDGYAWKSFIW